MSDAAPAAQTVNGFIKPDLTLKQQLAAASVMVFAYPTKFMDSNIRSCLEDQVDDMAGFTTFGHSHVPPGSKRFLTAYIAGQVEGLQKLAKEAETAEGSKDIGLYGGFHFVDGKVVGVYVGEGTDGLAGDGKSGTRMRGIGKRVSKHQSELKDSNDNGSQQFFYKSARGVGGEVVWVKLLALDSKLDYSYNGNGAPFSLHVEVGERTLKSKDEVLGLIGAYEATFIALLDAVAVQKRADGWSDTRRELGMINFVGNGVKGYNVQVGIEPTGARWAQDNPEYHRWVSAQGGKAVGEKIKAGLIPSNLIPFLAKHPKGSPWRKRNAQKYSERMKDAYIFPNMKTTSVRRLDEKKMQVSLYKTNVTIMNADAKKIRLNPADPVARYTHLTVAEDEHGKWHAYAYSRDYEDYITLTLNYRRHAETQAQKAVAKLVQHAKTRMRENTNNSVLGALHNASSSSPASNAATSSTDKSEAAPVSKDASGGVRNEKQPQQPAVNNNSSVKAGSGSNSSNNKVPPSRSYAKPSKPAATSRLLSRPAPAPKPAAAPQVAAQPAPHAPPCNDRASWEAGRVTGARSDPRANGH